MDNLQLYIGAIECETPYGTCKLTGYEHMREEWFMLDSDGSRYSLIRARFTPILIPLSAMTEEHMREVINIQFGVSEVERTQLRHLKGGILYQHGKYSGIVILDAITPATTAYLLSKGYDLGLLPEGTYKLKTTTT